MWKTLTLYLFYVLPCLVHSFVNRPRSFRIEPDQFIRASSRTKVTASATADNKKHVVIVGAGWGGLSAAHVLAQQQNIQVTVVESAPRVGGLVRDGFTTTSGMRPAEAGQHGFWDNYNNIFRLLREEIPGLSVETALTDYAEQGQYSPKGLEAVWPIFRDQPIHLPTGLAQAAYTRFMNLSILDRLTAFPLVLAFSEFDDSPDAWQRFDDVSFRDLCLRLGVSKRCYEEAFEPMILTGLFAPGAQCSAAAALGMAYFFVLQSQTAFDVKWCRGNVGDVIFSPWVESLQLKGVKFETSTRVVAFELDEASKKISAVQCQRLDKDATEKSFELISDVVIFAVGATALNSFVRNSASLAKFEEFRRFANLRGTSVLATRLFLDQNVTVPYSANACWGFDEGIGMTLFDIKSIHGENANTVQGAPGAVLEVDYYHSSNLLLMSDEDIVDKVKKDLDRIIPGCSSSKVVDAAVVRLDNAVNWYYPGSYRDMPSIKSSSLDNLYFAGDIVKTSHGSWSQEKAFVTGMEAANCILGRSLDEGVLPVGDDESHVRLGKRFVATARKVLGGGDESKAPSLVDFLL
jgi:uncharacterized protein with NAD-binding domain and iron-sulfur cluster